MWKLGNAARGKFSLGELKSEVLRIIPGPKLAYVADAVYSSANASRIIELAQDSDDKEVQQAFFGPGTSGTADGFDGAG